jgi:hypothetical protein
MGIETRVNHWHELSDEEKKIISDKRDYPIISVIDGLSAEERIKIYHLITPQNLTVYNAREKEWISLFGYFLDENLKRKNLDHSPEVIKNLLLDEMINGITHVRFRLYYAARYRTDVGLSDDKELTNFLSEVDLALKENASA